MLEYIGNRKWLVKPGGPLVSKVHILQVLKYVEWRFRSGDILDLYMLGKDSEVVQRQGRLFLNFRA